MPVSKRPYAPKVKGCYECSQRRINCDRGPIACRKCLAKGLKCSGLGIRHRFNKGVAARGNWAGKTIESVYHEMTASPVPALGTTLTSPKPARLAEKARDESTNPAKRPSSRGETPLSATASELETNSLSTTELFWNLAYNFVGSWSSTATGIEISLPSTVRSEEFRTSFLEDVVDLDNTDHPPSNNAPLRLHPCSSLDNIPAYKRRLLLHYSENIASFMIAVDGPHNGWRHLVLPIAETDQLVMDAVLATSLFHRPLLNQGRAVVDDSESNRYYARVIEGLRERSQLKDCDRQGQHAIILTILLLLTAGMVSASTDFPILFGMLQSAVDAIGGLSDLGNGDLAEFLVRQIRKMRVYAAPLLSEDSGVRTISSEAEIERMFDCLNHCLKRHPEHACILQLVPDLVRQACGIYLNHIQYGGFGPAASTTIAMRVSDSIHRVQRFKETFEAFPHGAPGKEVLIWACFIAASDCLLEEHKAFFEQFFMRQYAKSGFKNLEMGLAALRNIWARSPTERWTTLLPQVKLFVM